MSPIAFAGDAEAAAADANYPYAPAGEGYFLKVRNAKEQMSKGNPKKGTPSRPMIALEYVIAEGEHEGLHVFNYLVFIEAGSKGHGMTLNALKAHGLPWEGEIEISAADFQDVMVKVDLGVEEYPEGSKQMKNVIKKYHLAPSEEEMGTAQEPAPEPAPEPEPEPTISKKEQEFKDRAVKAGLAKPTATVKHAAKPAVRKPLPWKKGK